MSIWGKIIGGAAGFAIGGPLGALIGAGMGHAVDTGIDVATGQTSDEATRKITFTIGVIALSAKMAKADGQVTRDEVEAFKRMFHVPPHEMKNVGRVFDLAKRDTAGFEAYARQIANLFKGNSMVLEDLVGALFSIAMADGVLHPAEDEYLTIVARIFGLSDSCYASLKAQHTGHVEDDPYSVLKVDRGIADADLKKAYRNLVRENHPDKVIAEGLPQEFVNVANERLAAINAAYDIVAQERGLK